MKFEVCTSLNEGFVCAYMLRFENQLMLRTTDLTWATSDELKEIKAKFSDLVKDLEKAGFECVGGLHLVD